MEITKKRLVIYVITAFLVGALLTGATGALIYSGVSGYVKISKEDYKTMSAVYDKYGKLEQLYRSIDKYYYKDFDEQSLLEGSYKGLVEGLDDPYSSYMTAAEYESWKATATGEYSGVGITFSENDQGNYIIVGVQKNSPAAKAGLKTGDYIISVDGKKYDDMEMMANAIRGDEGTKVKLTYYRDGKEKEVALAREKIVQESVEYKMLDGSVGYIKIGSFINNTAADFDKALKDLEKQGATALVLDLRDNGGGLVDASIDVADEFLDKGVVTYVEDGNKQRKEYKSEDGKTDLKTIVLVNENSASASEILAAALKDNGIKLVGKTTYGKGVIQSTAELEDGSALKLTIMQYFSPKGSEIHKKGVKPDYEVDNSEGSESDIQLQKALSLF